ncbi:MAG: DNA-processing protein DprA [Arenimonas sp.]|nr:DNA-processing protein DprA [Arenimonas sp.]
MQRDELGAWLRLVMAPGLGPVTIRRLLGAFGLPAQVLAQPDAALGQHLSAAQLRALRAIPADWQAQCASSWDWLQAADATQPRAILALGDARYPAALLQAPDPPPLLWAAGLLPASWPPAVSVVGSRNPTPQGLALARGFGEAFAQAGVTVVSGLARGVDGAAHAGALDAAAPDRLATVAVVGTGLDRVYPAVHRELAHRIARAGLLLSEYPLGTGPLAGNFPRRNRLIAALGQGTLVVEAALRSGSLITARLAAELGREVYAVPGSVHAPQSRGCHALLREGAKLVETAQDVLEDLALPATPTAPAAAPAPQAPESPLLQALGWGPVGLDALVARTGLDAGRLQAQLLELELAGEVARLPGSLYQRQARA